MGMTGSTIYSKNLNGRLEWEFGMTPLARTIIIRNNQGANTSSQNYLLGINLLQKDLYYNIDTDLIYDKTILLHTN